MPVSINITMDRDATSLTLQIDDGSGEVQTAVVPMKLDKPKKVIKSRVAEEASALPSSEDERTRISDVFTRFIDTGDITEIRAIPNHKERFKHYVFAQITGMKGRTLYAQKTAGANKSYIGIMPPGFWNDDVIHELTQMTEKDSIDCIILDDGNKPSVVHDIMFLDKDWNSRGRVFNSLYRKPQRGDD